MFIEYISENSFLNRIDVRTKLFGFITAMAWCFLFQNPLYNLSLLVGIGLLGLQSKVFYKRIWQIIKPLLPICIILLLFTGLTYPSVRFQREVSQGVLFSIHEGWIACSVGGLLTGVNFICRLLIMVLGSSLVALTTSLDEFMELLNRLHVPEEITFLITTALRFMPTLDKKRLHILEAQKARGAKISDKSSIGRIKSYLPLMVPLFINAILIADNLAKGMLNRGYGYTSSIVLSQKRPMTVRDYLLLGILVSFISCGVYLRVGLKFGVL